MDKTLQEKYRLAVVEKYEERAWECLGLYDYYGKEYSKIEKNVKEYEDRVKTIEARIQELLGTPDSRTPGGRENIKGLKKDVQDYKNRIQGVAKVHKEYWDQSVKFREDAVRHLEQAENFKSFKVKTPEEIETDKGKPVEELQDNKI